MRSLSSVEPPIGFADGANNSGGQVSAAADIVKDFARVVLHEQAVDREVTARNVFLWGPSVDDLVRMAAIGIAHIAAEGSDFYFDAVAEDEDDSELGTDPDRIGEQLHDLEGRGVSGHVVIGGITIEQKIADTAADKQSLVAVLLKGGADRIGKFSGIHVLIMRQPCPRGGTKMRFQPESRSHLQRRTRQVMSSDWRV